MEIIPSFYGSKIVFHGGSVEVLTASFAYSRTANCGIVNMANGTGYSTDRIALYGMALLMGKDAEALPVIKLDNLLRQLEGSYSAYNGTVLAEVKRNGSFLMLSGEDVSENIVLIPESANSAVASFYTFVGTAKGVVEFRLDRQSVEMIYERYKYRKIGPLKLEWRTEDAEKSQSVEPHSACQLVDWGSLTYLQCMICERPELLEPCSEAW